MERERGGKEQISEMGIERGRERGREKRERRDGDRGESLVHLCDVIENAEDMHGLCVPYLIFMRHC